jgi:NTE family protein
MDKSSGIGLVFAGGGAKGAYQMGVWNAIRTFGIDAYISAVSGTSIGAMNAYLYASGNMDMGLKLWSSIKKEDILYFDPDEFALFFEQFAKRFGKGKETDGTPWFTRRQLNLFSRERLVEMLESVITDPALPTTPIDCYATCYCCESQSAVNYKLNKKTKQEAVTILTATSAIPGAYSPVEMQGKHYYDGGMGENVPVSPLYEKGYRNFIVVYLAQRDYIEKSRYPGSHFVEIVPSLNLGDFFTGTLNFHQEAIADHLQQGYNDAKDIFSRYQNVYEMLLGENGQEPIDTEPKLKKLAKLLIAETIREIVK